MITPTTTHPTRATGRRRLLVGTVGAALLTVGGLAAGSAAAAPSQAPGQLRTEDVSGTGVHRFTESIVHQEATPDNGFVQRSTDVVELRGDVEGYILYHVTSVIDPVAGTLTNRGEQWFSGTILGSAPVVLHDDQFEFVVQLADGTTAGEVFLRRSGDAPQAAIHACDLHVVGTGETTPAGDAVVSYAGTCTRARP